MLGDPSGKVRRDVLSERAQELPRHDERLIGRAHRYGYTTEFSNHGHGIQLGSLLKHDLSRGTVELHDVGPTRAAMDPVFVPCTCPRASPSGSTANWIPTTE